MEGQRDDNADQHWSRVRAGTEREPSISRRHVIRYKHAMKSDTRKGSAVEKREMMRARDKVEMILQQRMSRVYIPCRAYCHMLVPFRQVIPCVANGSMWSMMQAC